KPYSNSQVFNKLADIFHNNVNMDQLRKSNPNDYYQLENSLSGVHILLVEDNELNQQVAKELFVGQGATVQIASDGRMAIDKLLENSKDTPFDIVLMDLQMPVMDGMTATQIIREDQRFIDLPIIALSADVVSGVKEKCLALGMQDFIYKPIDPNTAIKTIRSFVSIKMDSIPNNAVSFDSLPHESGQSYPNIEFPEIKGIDVADGLRRVGRNTKAYFNVLFRFLEDYADIGDKLNETLESVDRSEMIRFFHTLKGVSGNLGMKQIYSLAAELEVLATENEPKDYAEEVSKLKSQIDVVLTELFQLKQQFDSNKANPSDTQKISQTELVKLSDYIDQDDPEALTEVRNLIERFPLDNDLVLLEKAIRIYDFSKARVILLDLQKGIETK
nr:response regulator [Bacteroidales bacterium]